MSVAVHGLSDIQAQREIRGLGRRRCEVCVHVFVGGWDGGGDARRCGKRRSLTLLHAGQCEWDRREGLG